MEKNNKKLYIIITILFIVIIALGGYILFEKFINKEDNNTNSNDIYENVVKVALGDYFIYAESLDNKLFINSSVYLSYDSDIYDGATFSGYCTGSDNESYAIYGPLEEETIFDNNGETKIYFRERASQNVKYSNGEIKLWEDIDWKKVKIKYCNISEVSLIRKDGGESLDMEINYERYYKDYKKELALNIDNLHKYINDIRKDGEINIKDRRAWYEAATISGLFNVIVGDIGIYQCNFLTDGNYYSCGKYKYNINLSTLTYYGRDFDLTNKLDVNNLINYMTYNKYQNLYYKNEILMKDTASNGEYCIGYYYDKNYFYFDYYTDDYHKMLWSAFNPYTGECELNNKVYNYSYQIDRKTLDVKKIVRKIDLVK